MQVENICTLNASGRVEQVLFIAGETVSFGVI